MYFFLFLFACLDVYVRVSEALELELQTPGVNCYMTGSFGRAVTAPNHTHGSPFVSLALLGVHDYL